MAKTWWVNQKWVSSTTDYATVWAPLANSLGRKQSHWDSMDEVEVGDVIFHKHGDHIVGISMATGKAVAAPRPWNDREGQWAQAGRKIPVELALLEPPIEWRPLVSENLEEWTGKGTPFQTGKARGQEGYFYPLPEALAHRVFNVIGVGVDLSPAGRAHIEIEGETDREGIAKLRREQGQLRSRLLNGRESAPCTLCGEEFPSHYLVAAHILPRSRCTEKERKSPDVAMLACAFGCDAAFERGDIFVDEDGRLQARAGAPAIVSERYKDVVGRRLTTHAAGLSPFYRRHRELHRLP